MQTVKSTDTFGKAVAGTSLLLAELSRRVVAGLCVEDCDRVKLKEWCYEAFFCPSRVDDSRSWIDVRVRIHRTNGAGRQGQVSV